MMLDGNTITVEKTMEQVAASTGRKRRRAWLVGAVLLLLILAAALAAGLRRDSSPVGFQTQPVQTGNLTVTVSATGNLEATNQVEVGSEMSGIITRMTADYNDTVQAGQPLAYLNAGDFFGESATYRLTTGTAIVTRKQVFHLFQPGILLLLFAQLGGQQHFGLDMGQG